MIQNSLGIGIWHPHHYHPPSLSSYYCPQFSFPQHITTSLPQFSFFLISSPTNPLKALFVVNFSEFPITVRLAVIMAVVAVLIVIFLAMTGLSSATYCICKDGLSDSILQKDIDYACGAGADCSPVTQNGACYNPNTLKDHCNYAVNSYFQKKSQVNGSCDFSGTATTTQTLSSTNSACVYPSSASTAGTTNGTTTPSTGTTTPSTGTTNGTTTPFTTTPSSTIPTTFPSYGPTTSTTGNINKASLPLYHQNKHLFWSFLLALFLSGPMILRV